MFLFLLVSVSCRTLDYPPKAYVQYETKDAILLIDKNDIIKMLKTNGSNPDIYNQSIMILSDYTCLSNPIILQHDSVFPNSSDNINDKYYELLGDVYTYLYNLFIKHKPIVYDKRRKAFDKKYYFKEEGGLFCVCFEDGHIFLRTYFPRTNDIAYK